MAKDRIYISFDRALKRLLRDKANFDVLEGFLSTLLFPVHYRNTRRCRRTRSPRSQEKLKSSKMSREEQTAYRRYLDDRFILADQIYTARGEDHLEGREEGREQGKEETNRENAWKMKQLGLPSETISQVTGLSKEEINSLS